MDHHADKSARNDKNALLLAIPKGYSKVGDS